MSKPITASADAKTTYEQKKVEICPGDRCFNDAWKKAGSQL